MACLRSQDPRTISGYESRRSPYPQRRSFYRSLAPSPIKLTQKRLSRLSQLSFSPSTPFVERRSLSSLRSSASLPTGSLPGLALNGPSSTRLLEAWPGPRRGISSNIGASPTWTDPARAWREYVPVAHFQYAKNEVNASDFGLPRIEVRFGHVRATHP
jgi:hypothetical protein